MIADSPVTFPKHAAVTLTLRRMADGAFEVLGDVTPTPPST